MKVEITYDKGKVYDSGTIMQAEDLLNEFIDCILEDFALKDWLKSLPIKSALDYIAYEWGLRYKFVGNGLK